MVTGPRGIGPMAEGEVSRVGKEAPVPPGYTGIVLKQLGRRMDYSEWRVVSSFDSFTCEFKFNYISIAHRWHLPRPPPYPKRLEPRKKPDERGSCYARHRRMDKSSTLSKILT